MKKQALFSSKDKSKKKIKCRLLQILFGAFTAKTYSTSHIKVCRPCIVNGIYKMLQTCTRISGSRQGRKLRFIQNLE